MTPSDVSGAAVWLFFHVIPSRFGRWQQPDSLDPEVLPVVWTEEYELRKLTVSWTRAVGLTPVQDAAQCTFHFLNLTGGDPDPTWTDADFTTVETAFDAYWGALKTWYAPTVSLTEYEWRKDGPAYRPHTPKPGGLLSPTVRAVARAVPGTSTGAAMAPQVAISVTEIVPAKYTAHDVEGSGDQIRNRWGRWYLPAPAATDAGSSQASVNGRISSTLAQLAADKSKLFYDTCNAASIVPVMYSPTTGTSWAVQSLHVDDIWDVIRSRRFITPANRHAVTLTSPPAEIG